jgi:hypothetical protein
MTHIELDVATADYQDIEQMAKAMKRPTTQVIRDAATVFVERWRLRQGQEQYQGLGKLAKLGIKGPRDLATHLDDYLYGDKQ